MWVTENSFRIIFHAILWKYHVAFWFVSFQEPTKKPRNPTPVTNPDRGSHYLKKSPSPTGAKDPPTLGNGTTINTSDEYLQRKAMLTCGQQVSWKCTRWVISI